MAGQRSRYGRYLLADLRDLLERPGGLVGVLVTAVGLLLMLVGLLGAVLVGPGSTWHAGKTLRPGAPAVVVTSGVVGAIGPQVTVSVRRTDGAQLFVGRAITRDVQDLTRTAPRLVVSGVHPLHRLSSASQPGSTSLANVTTSDIWRETSVGRGTRSLDWRPGDESQSVLIASTDGSALPALKLTVTWHRSGWFPAAVLLLVAGFALVTFGFHSLTGRRLVPRLVDRLLAAVGRIPVPARRGHREAP